MKRTQAGFTMIELMIVVAVIGILSAVAIPSFRSYIHRSRTAEAFTFLGEVRQRQEAYRAEFGYDGSDFWFVAQAQGDMDGDGEVMIVEAYSASRVFFVGDASMSPLPSRYE
ncbi:MAG: prepilin-type N-terminal cleavage/methylation domain-containing protein [Sandaracinaceae bacterium]|nr:prepilin-type N-terminal cleavage/methylation domain-containing protein [Sandaracinaceae bacterium]